jgi:hypothetical protein
MDQIRQAIDKKIVILIVCAILSSCTLGSTENPSRSYYSDREVETFIDQFPQLAISINDDPVPKDILQRLEIDIAALKVLESYIGDCPTLTVYYLSPSYDLVVDENACFGYQVFIRER